MPMMVVNVTNAPPRLRGRLGVWLLEVRAGLYVGNYSRRVREMIWEQMIAALGPKDDDFNAVMIWAAPTDAGFDLDTLGTDRRIPEDFDGLQVVRYTPRDSRSTEDRTKQDRR